VDKTFKKKEPPTVMMEARLNKTLPSEPVSPLGITKICDLFNKVDTKLLALPPQTAFMNMVNSTSTSTGLTSQMRRATLSVDSQFSSTPASSQRGSFSRGSLSSATTCSVEAKTAESNLRNDFSMLMERMKGEGEFSVDIDNIFGDSEAGGMNPPEVKKLGEIEKEASETFSDLLPLPTPPNMSLGMRMSPRIVIPGVSRAGEARKLAMGSQFFTPSNYFTSQDEAVFTAASLNKRSSELPKAIPQTRMPSAESSLMASERLPVTGQGSQTRAHQGKRARDASAQSSSLADGSNAKRTRTAPTSDLECSICFKRFTTRGNTKRHFLTHSAAKKFKCNRCPKAFHQKSHLVKHLRVHTGEKPFACRLCNKCFSQRSSRASHERMHARHEAKLNAYNAAHGTWNGRG
jgi:hypothetical protein